MGPDVRRLLEVYPKVLDAIRVEMSRIHGEAEATAFVACHSPVFKELAVISHLSSAPRFLLDAC